MWELFGDFNEAHFLLLGTWGTPVLVAMGLGVALVLVLSFLDLRVMKPRWRAHLLLGLRALVLALALLLLLEPALELRDVERERNQVAIVVDGSHSMAVEERGDDTRRDLAIDVVEELEPLWGAPSEKHTFDFFLFGEEPKRTSAAAIRAGELADDPDLTHIRESLEAVVNEIGRNRLGGIVLISDGTDGAVLGGRNPSPDAALDSESFAWFEGLGAPVHAFAAASSSDLRDVAITEVLHDEFAFIRNRVAFDVTLRGLGIGGNGVQVELWENGTRLRAQQVVFTEDDEEQTVTFELVPEKLGKAVYSVVASPVSDEAIEENNRYHFVMKVIRDKIRVLQVCGRPSWDERFMRRLLKENANVDLISFFILRTNQDIQTASNDELSLIPFPKDELFDAELPSFDLVIFQNFNFGPYVLRRYMDGIAEFVRAGGGFVMIGGDLSFSSGGYSGTALADVLPVELYPGPTGDSLISGDDFAPMLTPAGRRHPISKLSFDGAENERLWQSLPLLEGSNLVRGLKPDATALAVHPTLRSVPSKTGDAASEMPVIAVREVGEGRTMSFTTDSSWLWAFENAGQGGTARPFNSFWNNAIRWLIQDPELKLIKVELAEEQVEPGAPIEARVEVLESDYSPAAHVNGRYTVYRRALDEPVQDGAQAGDVVQEGELTTDARGLFELSLESGEPGVYTVAAEVERASTTINDDDIVLVVTDSPELRDIAPRPDLLRRIARATGGRYVELPTPGESLEELELNEPRVTRINHRKLLSLWDSWLVFVVFGLLLAMEWILRRRFGRL